MGAFMVCVEHNPVSTQNCIIWESDEWNPFRCTVQVLCPRCGSHPMLRNICTDCKSQKYDPLTIVSSCFCEVILVFFFQNHCFWMWLICFFDGITLYVIRLNPSRDYIQIVIFKPLLHILQFDGIPFTFTWVFLLPICLKSSKWYSLKDNKNCQHITNENSNSIIQ